MKKDGFSSFEKFIKTVEVIFTTARENYNNIVYTKSDIRYIVEKARRLNEEFNREFRFLSQTSRSNVPKTTTIIIIKNEFHAAKNIIDAVASDMSYASTHQSNDELTIRYYTVKDRYDTMTKLYNRLLLLK